MGGLFLSLRLGAVSDYDPQIFYLLRLPRTISAVAVGGGLSVAGALIQASLGNPLADPYTIGIASSAALGAVIGSLLKGHPLLTGSIFAFVFSVIGLLALSTWLRKSFRHSTEVLLTGAVSGFFFTSLATLIMALADPAEWSSAFVRMMGTLGNLTLAESICVLIAILVVCAFGWMSWKAIDLIAVDELSAESAGVDVALVRRRIFFVVAIITAISVSSAGVIGFLGLIVPHILRRLHISSHLILVPLSFVTGAGLLLCSDVLARMIIRPSEIPVGVVMSVIGAPVFLYLARKKV